MADPILGEQQFVPNQLVTTNRTRFYRDPSSGALSVQYTKDGGTTWKQFISEPSSLATEGWVPSLTASGDVVWRPVATLVSDTASATTSTQPWTDFMFPGTLYTDKEFGYFKVPQGYTLDCYGSQMTIFTPATGSSITVRLVNLQSGASVIVGQEMFLGINKLTSVNLISPVRMTSNSEWRLTLTSVGSIDAGEFLSCRLMFNTVE